MTPQAHEQWNRAAELFAAASDLPPGQRDAWLRRECGDDQGLFEEVQSLLNASIAEAEASRNAAINRPDGVEGRRYGPWEAIRVLGSGGMGSVLLVRRAGGEFEQTAALKLIAPHLAGPYFLDRFRAERQILAQLNHPNIAKLVDGGTVHDDSTAYGVPYLVMEFVDGLPFDQHADEQRMSIHQRLEMFLKVCEAVEFAHRNLIVHRDLKPGNILIESATGQPKLLDFGAARMLTDSSGAATTHRLVTLRYASPEALRRAPITTQSDVFSLGVLLYESVTGVWPFGDASTAVEALKRITDSDISPPGSRVTDETARSRSCKVRELQAVLKGDLAAVLRKATEADLARRYTSVSELASDIRAYLAGRPVSARPRTALYMISKFVRRNRATVAATAALASVLLGVGIYALLQARLAATRYVDLRAVTRTLLFDLNRAIREIPGSTESQKLLVSRVVPVIDNLASQARTEPAVRRDLAEAYRQLGDLLGNQYSQNLGDLDGSLAVLEKARSLSAEALRAGPDDVEWLKAHASIEQTYGETLFSNGNTAKSLEHLRDSAASWDKVLTLLGPGRVKVIELAEAASAHGGLADALGQPGTQSLRDQAGAEKQYRLSLECTERALVLDPGFKRSLRSRLIVQMKLGNLILYTAPNRALEFYQAALGRVEEGDFRLRSMLLRKLGEAAHGLNRDAEAAGYYEQSMAIDQKLLVVDAQDMRARTDLVIAQKGLADVYAFMPNREADMIALLEASTKHVEILHTARPTDENFNLALADNACKLAGAMWRQPALRERAESLATLCMRDLDRMTANPGTASPHVLQVAAEHYYSIVPERLRNYPRAVAAAKGYLERSGANDVWGLYLLASAQQASGDPAAGRAAREALPLLEPGDSFLREQFRKILGAASGK